MTTVILVDDSATARLLLRGVLTRDGTIQVIGEAVAGVDALDLARRLQPDVIVMDVVMPDVDGFEATRRIMAERPCPIVLVSASYPSEVASSLAALAAGAVTIVAKPQRTGSAEAAATGAELVGAVKRMEGVRLVRRTTTRQPAADKAHPTTGQMPTPRTASIVAIGASTGGPRAIATVLSGLPASFPVPILMVQHIGYRFTAGLAAWLHESTPISVRLAIEGEVPRAGSALIAGGDHHLGLAPDGRVHLSDAPPIGEHRPSATHLFRSVASVHGPGAVGVILTGMGSDGAPGLVDLHAAGGRVVGQDEATCVVYGMPRAAAARRAVDLLAPLDAIAAVLQQWCASVPTGPFS